MDWVRAVFVLNLNEMIVKRKEEWTVACFMILSLPEKFLSVLIRIWAEIRGLIIISSFRYYQPPLAGPYRTYNKP